MQYKYIIIVLSMIFLSGCSQSIAVTVAHPSEMLKIDTKGHTAGIMDILVTHDGSEVVTCSQDKTIRVWDAKTGEERRKILGEIGFGIDGANYAMALSPDDKYLAVGGYYAVTKSQYIPIRIYNFHTGKLLYTLKGHTEPILSLAFSKDGELLLSASSDKSIGIWIVRKKFKLFKKIINSSSVTSIAPQKILQEYNLFSIEGDGILHKTDLNNAYSTEMRGILKKDRDYSIYRSSLATTNHNGGELAACINDTAIYIYDFNLKKIHSINTDVHCGDLAYTPDGKKLIVGAVDRAPFDVAIYDATKEYRQVTDFKKHDADVSSVAFLDNTTAISAGGQKNRVYIWDINTKKIKSTLDGDGKSIKVIGVSGDTIAWGSKAIEYDQTTDRKNFPNLQELSLLNGEYSLPPLSTNSFVESIQIYKKSHKRVKIAAIPSEFMGFYTYGWYKNYIIAGGAGVILVYDINGNKVASLEGYSDNKYSLALDGDQLVNRAGEYTKVWDLTQIGTKKKIQAEVNWSRSTIEYERSINITDFQLKKDNFLKLKQIALTNGVYTLPQLDGDVFSNHFMIYKDNRVFHEVRLESRNQTTFCCYGWYGDYIVAGLSSGTIKIYDINGKEVASLIGHNQQVYTIALDGDRLVSGGRDQTIKVWDLSKVTKQDIIKPTLSIFVGKTDEWVAWTDDGFFNASKNGGEYIGYHINQGTNKEAVYVTVDALFSSFYRPDLIQEALKGKSLEKYAKKINIKKIVKDGLAPEVHILTHTKQTSNRDIELKLQVCPKGKGGYDNLTLLLNETAVSVVNSSRALKRKKKAKRSDCFINYQTLSLTAGLNKIGFRATNKAGTIESKTDSVDITFDDRNRRHKLQKRLQQFAKDNGVNDLHILTIAVNNYKDKELQLNYSINDAKGVIETIENVAQPLFKHVYTYTLFDKEVTKENIAAFFSKIKSTRKDVFLLYLAGHGKTDEFNGNYYYIPYDFSYDDDEAIQKQGIGQKEFMIGLSKVSALKSLILLDTCNSGSFVESEMQKTTTNRLSRATGRAIISASSKYQVALEGYKQHGFFTYVLMDALNTKAYHNNKVSVHEVEGYISKALPELTQKYQHFRQIPQSSMYGVDFDIGIKQ